MKTLITITTVAMMLLTGCGEPKQEVKPTQYYNENIDEAKAVVEECKNIASPSMEQVQNCSNAKTAVWHSGSLKTVKGNERSVKTWKE